MRTRWRLCTPSHWLNGIFDFAPVSRIETLFTLNISFGQITGFPFGLFGLFALVVLVVMAATRHDFWLCFLTPRF